MAYVIAAPCVGVKDTACVDACPVDCIHPRRDEVAFAEAKQVYIEPERCICCGACVPVCPVNAIFLAEDLPPQWKDYVQTNAEWYTPNDEPRPRD
ncbi:MAG: 4Fe-4S binding protein [Acidobacteria bacterium]|nr:4Fe-4S binding protein [Acidobacteriota bacterium]